MNNILLLIDGNALMHRSYHGMSRGHFQPTYNDMSVSMVYGFASTVINAVQHFNPRNIVVTFDTKEKTFRHEMDENYKAHRQKAPDDFYPQLPYIHEFVEATGIPSLMIPGFESDDLIGSISTQTQEQFNNVYILSGDLDFLQLVNDTIELVKFNGKIENSVHYGPTQTKARYDITPKQMIDFKAITGDSSDNYKGIPGVGPKTAAMLLNEYENINGIYQNLKKIKPKLQEKFTIHRDDLFLCQKLATIKTDIDHNQDLSIPSGWNEDDIKAFFTKVNFPSLTKRMEAPKKKQEVKKKKEADTAQGSLF